MQYVEFLKGSKDDVITVSHMTPIVHMLRELCYEGRREQIRVDNCSLFVVEDGKIISND